MRRLVLLAILSLSAAGGSSGQDLDPGSRWATETFSQYRIIHDIVYKKSDGNEVKLDVVTAAEKSAARPTVIFIHGGGWVGGTKEDHFLFLLPYLARGMNAVDVEYRKASVALAPAAVADCRCALRWVYQHANDYGFDTSKLVVAGESAGGHLSLMTGMLSEDAGFDNDCPGAAGAPPLKVAAIIDYCGITDVADLLDGPHRQTFALMWLGNQPNRKELARQLSPLTYVRAGLPPTIILHGDQDDTVPYQQGVRLHDALDRAGVANQMISIPGGKHWGWPREQYLRGQAAIFAFLADHGVLSK
jgi:acetyl esterase/lipase